MVELLPDVIKSASEALQVNLPGTTTQADGALSTVVGFFNNVVLYPVKRANITYRYKLEAFEDDLKKKAANIPEENLQVPPTMIAGPTLEALKYTYDEEELREMYENLLVSAMDSRTSDNAHPSFVDAIKQMSPLDARVLKEIVQAKKRLKCASIVFEIKGSNQVYTKGMPNWFVIELESVADPFLVSSSILNLQRLGLIEISDGSLSGEDYSVFETHPYVQSRLNMFNSFGKEIIVQVEKRAVTINNYGAQFAKVCL